MGTIVVNCGDEKTTSPLFPSTLVGRGNCCQIVVNGPNVPLYWVELRWMSEGWAWRVLVDTGNTRGTGRILGNNWRLFSGENSRISIGNDTWIALSDDSPPQLVIENLQTGKYVSNGRSEDYLELTDKGYLPLDHEYQRKPQIVQNRSRMLVCGEWLQFHLPDNHMPTYQNTHPFIRAEAALEIQVGNSSATLVMGNLECVIRGQHVRTLAVYSLARTEAAESNQGWLSAREAHAWWINLGGNKRSPLERLGWDRGKIRSQLVQQGLTSVIDLFESKRQDGVTFTRLTISARQISVLIGASNPDTV